jgi:hypothetical protein
MPSINASHASGVTASTKSSLICRHGAMSQFARHSTFLSVNRPSAVVSSLPIASRFERWSNTASLPRSAQGSVEQTWNTYLPSVDRR